jgi:predicted nucleic acid-binding protein
MDDLVFVALNEYLDKVLWTGDMKLYKGLKKKGYKKVVTFREIQKALNIL